MRTRVACVYRRQEDGLFGWKARGAATDNTHYQDETQAIEKVYEACGIQ